MRRNNCIIKIVSNLNEDSYDYVFGGRRNVLVPSTPTLNLTSPPIRIRPEGESYSYSYYFNYFNYFQYFLIEFLIKMIKFNFFIEIFNIVLIKY